MVSPWKYGHGADIHAFEQPTFQATLGAEVGMLLWLYIKPVSNSQKQASGYWPVCRSTPFRYVGDINNAIFTSNLALYTNLIRVSHLFVLCLRHIMWRYGSADDADTF